MDDYSLRNDIASPMVEEMEEMVCSSYNAGVDFLHLCAILIVINVAGQL